MHDNVSNRPIQPFSFVCTGLLALMLVVGCHRGPAVVFVEGIVRLDGAPLEGASVAFTPVEASGGAAAAGFTDAQGRFVLSARGARLGAGTTVGEYVVIVSKTMIPTAEEAKDSPDVVLLTPEAYRIKESSPLRATVKKGRNRFEFDLLRDSK